MTAHDKTHDDMTLSAVSYTCLFLFSISVSSPHKHILKSHFPKVKIPIGKSCGFVQFVRKEDAERAIDEMQGFVIHGSHIRLSWRKNRFRPSLAPRSSLPANTNLSMHAATVSSHDALRTRQPEILNGMAWEDQLLQQLSKLGYLAVNEQYSQPPPLTGETLRPMRNNGPFQWKEGSENTKPIYPGVQPALPLKPISMCHQQRHAQDTFHPFSTQGVEVDIGTYTAGMLTESPNFFPVLPQRQTRNEWERGGSIRPTLFGYNPFYDLDNFSPAPSPI
ncbi:hypothetical protein B0H10DRAFT_1943643 [Mycena sp. CBHHK59/15]|nr:hypothetical protein B0H10DRAFT_1943643 [Mycena sp. CBHHK59/15]